MKNVTQSGYETITVVRSQYDPVIGQCLTISPVLWIKESKDKNIEDQKYFVFARNGCIRDIFDIKDPIPLEILTECGYVQADENGQIQVEGSCGIRVTSKDCPDFCFVLRTGFGLKGGGQICNGEEREIALDAEITGDVKGPDSAKVGDVPIFKDETGKSITTSNINSVDGLTKIVKSTKGEQKLLVETVDTEAGSNAGVEAKSTGSGTPYFQLTQGDQKWRRIINPETGALEIRPIDDLSKDPILTMMPNGVMLMPWQPKCTAKLAQKTPNFAAGQEYEIGSTRAFVKLRDTDGYNLNANNFFPGDGNGKYAYYTCPYTGGYNIGWQFIADRTTITDPIVKILLKLVFGPPSNEQSLRYSYLFGPDSYQTISDYVSLPLNKGDRIRWNIMINQGQPYINVFASGNEIDNFIGILFVG